MSRHSPSCLIIAGTLAMMAAPALAQRGGGGPPAGVGGGFGGGFGGRPSFAGTPGGPNGGSIGGGFGGSRASTQSSTRVLGNTHVTTSLTAALQHSGVTLPAGGLKDACAGFSNLGGCIAALHVAQNLGVPGGFDALKALVTGSNKIKLGQAITQLQPSANAKAQERTARRQAEQDLESSSEGD